ncbi:hypothetical protein GPX89_13000 [Nocardia sp. ET3-3]|uniref:DUF4352 domain-containing protein n=1 Tax=Nocardia terrae TaxID=2675851 RepID=A0A7K1UVG5_9NOCA|nr:hypothetical protein [Nocardia terrae]MVU78159.1 hypothetical protein [Nocardia terrae]
MTYPPGGFGGDPNAHGQQPQDPNPAWWDQPQSTGGEQPAEGQGWQPTQLNMAVQQAHPQQGFPQDPGYGQQPGYPQDGGFGQPQGYAQAPGYAPQPGYPQQPGFPPQQPPKSKAGLIVGVIAAVVVVLAVAVGAIVLVSKKDDSSQAAATSTTSVTTSDSAPTTTRGSAPTTSKAAAPGGKKFSYTEYGKDWNFKFGDVALQATYVSGRDFDSCAPVEANGKLTGLGCTAASEMAWKSENGGLMLTQLVLTMSDETKASAAVDQFEDDDVVLPSGSYIADFDTGKWMDGNQGKFLVITEVTTTAEVDEPTASKYLKYRHKDTIGALMFR